MTKPLSKADKKERKEARRKSKQQRAASETVKTVTQPKPEDSKPTETPPSPVNLCDDCAYEFGECEGVPKFAQEEGADDRVIECSAFVNVAKMPTADQGKKEAAAEDKSSQVATREDTSQEAEAVEEETAEARTAREADLEARRKKTQRFYQEEDFGPCQSCGQPLKRTALNRGRDAVRCVNVRCRQYRFIIRTIPTGV